MSVLSCPEPANYAAIAKQLHLTALQAEARIYVLEQQLRAAANRPTMVQTSTTSQTGIPANSLYRFGSNSGATFVNTFNNTNLSDTGDTLDSSTAFQILGEGLWEIGCSLTAVPSGAITADSQRLFFIEQRRPDINFPDGLLVQQAAYTMLAPPTSAGNEITLVGEFRMRPSDRIDYIFFHDNIASTITINAGVVMWASKISDATVLAVV